MANGVMTPAAGGADVNALNAEIASLQDELALERASPRLGSGGAAPHA